MRYVIELPQNTKAMISLLPSYFFIRPYTEEELMNTKCNHKFKTVGDIIKKINSNINEIGKKKPVLAQELSELLETQIQIICHGYSGIFHDDESANEIKNFINDNSILR